MIDSVSSHGEAFLDARAVADDNQVKRIALDRLRRVSGAARLPFKPGLESSLVELLGARRRLRASSAGWGRIKTRHLKREAEIRGVVAAQQSYLDPFYSFV